MIVYFFATSEVAGLLWLLSTHKYQSKNSTFLNRLDKSTNSIRENDNLEK